MTVLATVGAALTGQGVWLALGVAASFARLLRWRRDEVGSARVWPGVADALTGARLALILAVTSTFPRLPPRWVVMAFALNVVLDVLDGLAARRVSGTSRFGALFDRETDAVFVLAAYTYFHLAAGYGAWILVPGILPSVYRLTVTAAAASVPVDHREPGAATLAGLNFLLLIAAVALPELAPVILATSVTVVTVSFTASFRSLYRRHHARSLP